MEIGPLGAWFGPILVRGLEKILSTTHPALAIVRVAVRCYLALLATLAVGCFVGVIVAIAVYLAGR